jgi:hypothetical protein
MAVDITGVLETMFIAGDRVLYLKRILQKAHSVARTVLTTASRACIVLQ